MRMLKVYDFVTVTRNKKKLREHGIERGDTLFVQSHKILPVSNKDPYMQKVYLACHKVVDGHVQIPSLGSSDTANYLIDGLSLEWVGEDRQKELLELLEDDVATWKGQAIESTD